MIVRTNVKRHELTAAQGGIDPTLNEEFVWVECPDDYDVDCITAHDILHDGAIRKLWAWHPADWLMPSVSKQPVITATTTDEEIDRVAAELTAEALHEGLALDPPMAEFLREVRDEKITT